MALNVTQKLVRAHLAEGEMRPGEPIALKIDQTLTQDATGGLVMLALEALRLDRVQTELSVQYVDHNLLQTDNRNADDHLFLESACRRFGLHFSRPGNGVSHPVHMQRFGRPGGTLLGSDSHSCAAGSLGMLAIGAGGLDVAMAMAGEPFHLTMPEVWGVRLTGTLPDWVSAKDVILELLRRHGVDGGVGRVLEYHGPGVEGLSAMDRHVIANMGAELGATSSVFPSDSETRRFLESEGRPDDWADLSADEDAVYDHADEIDLSRLEPLIALPSSPGNVVPVREAAGAPIYQAYIGSSANPGYRDFAVAARIVAGRRVADGVSFDINPTSRQLLEILMQEGRLAELIHAGARLHQAGCNGCIGMGQAPATGRNSLRTTPRNFPGRSGTPEDSVFLCSPETAAASAIAGRIVDPRDLDMPCPRVGPPERPIVDDALVAPPLEAKAARGVRIVKGPNIADFPELAAPPDRLELEVVLALGDDVSTDEIMPAGADVLPYRNNIPKIAEFVFRNVDPDYVAHAREAGAYSGHAIVAGENYGQGSSREHAALAPRFLGLRAVLAKDFARIHRQNLINFGVLPLRFADPSDHARLHAGVTIRIEGAQTALSNGQDRIDAHTDDPEAEIALELNLTPRDRAILRAGGLINWAAAGGV